MSQEKDATKYPYNKPTQLFIIHINEPSLHSNKGKAPHVWLNTSETEDVVLISKEEGNGRQVQKKLNWYPSKGQEKAELLILTNITGP